MLLIFNVDSWDAAAKISAVALKEFGAETQ